MKKKVLVLITIMLFTISFGCGCGERSSEQAYRRATKKVQHTALNDEGTYVVTEELLIALQNAEYTEPKNIIYMIGDGMGANIIEATEEVYADDLYDNKLSINYLTNVGTQSTYSASAMVTDSAAGGTALSTGHKTSNGTIAMNVAHSENYKTVLEMAAEKGKSTGVIATKAVTDATPASFTAHVTERGLQQDIAKQQLEKISDGSLDLVLGGGSMFYEDAVNSEVFKEAEKQGMSYSTDWANTREDELPLVGLFAEEHMNTFDEHLPTLAEMTDFALNRLDEDEDGFFLMIEGSQIDTQAHSNYFEGEVHEMYQFDAAIAVAMRFVALHPDTVIVVTADHETGGLYFPKDGLGEDIVYNYRSGGHTSINVPVYALGYGIEELTGIKENTDIAGFIASLLGEQQFETESTITELFSARDSETVKMFFDSSDKNEELSTEALVSGISQVKNARAVHMVVRNIGEDRVTLPILRITTASSVTYDSVPQYAYIDAGESKELTYILPIELWEENALQGMTGMQLSYEIILDNFWKRSFRYTNEVSELEITKISITDRQLYD